jgi:protein gp37
MAETTIEWASYTFNPWSGCTKVSPGCANCYAEVNYSVKMRGVKWGPNGNRIVASDAYWKQPLKWDREALNATSGGVRPRVFCASLADVFEDWHGRMLDSKGRVLYWDQDDQTLCATENEHDDTYRNTATMSDFRRRLFDLINQTPNLDWLLLTKRPENITRMWPR